MYGGIVLSPLSVLAQVCPLSTFFGASTETSGSVENPVNAIGSIVSPGTRLNASNAARLAANDELTILLHHTVRSSTVITISLARDNGGGIVSISDNVGNTINFTSGPNDIAQRIQLTVADPTDRITITRLSGRVWIDGLTYEVNDCDGDGVVDLLDDDSDNDGIPNAIECAAFCSSIGLMNSSFEDPFVAPNTFQFLPLGNVPGWNTSDPSGNIEIWGTGFLGVDSYEGSQHAELNAQNSSALFQEICVSPGSEFSWSIAHRGRRGTDVAQVRIGASFASASVEAVMTTGNTAWELYTGIYTVPPGQTNTVIVFEAVSTAANNLSVGNFIDAVNIELTRIGCSDTDNDGIPNFLDLDSDNDGILDGLESGHGFALGPDGRLVGSDTGSGPNGLYDPIETSPESSVINYAVRDSEEVPDGMFDAYELDSDGDGCLDTFETNQEDDDEDGIIGTGVPTVDPLTGLVTTHGYAIPSLVDRWQNHLINHCQICRSATTNPHILFNRRGHED